VFSRSVWNLMVRCPPPLRRGATAASSPHSASPFPNQFLSPPGSSLSHSSSARRRAPSTALLHQRRGGSPAAAPPRGGSPAAARGTHHEGARWPPRGEPAPAVVLLLHPAPLAPAVPAPADHHGLHPGGICCCGRRGIS